MSDANRVELRIKEEATYGENPGGNFDILRFTGESLKQETGTTASNEIRSDRKIADLVRTQLSASGEANFELSYGVYDTLIQHALQSPTWAGAVTSTGAFATSDITSNVYSDSAETFITDGFEVGMWVRLSGVDETPDNTEYMITALTETAMTLAGHTMLDDPSPSGNITVTQIPEVIAGTTFNSVTIEKEMADLVAGTNRYAEFLGMAIDTWNLSVSPGQIFGGSFGFIGKSMTLDSTSGAGTPVAAPTNDVMNAIDNVPAIAIGSLAAAAPVLRMTNFTMQLQNNLRERLEIGTLGAASLGSGTISLTGTIECFFDNVAAQDTSALLASYLAFDDVALAVKIVDGDGTGAGTTNNAYFLSFPRVKFSDGEHVAGGINSDVVLSLSWQAIASTGTGARIFSVARDPKT